MFFALFNTHRHDVNQLELLHNKIIPTVTRVAHMPTDQIPLTKQDRRLPRTEKADTPEFADFVTRVYRRGYNDENFAGSELIEGGQEQSLDSRTAKELARKLMGLLKASHAHQTVRIKWVSHFIQTNMILCIGWNWFV